LSLTKRIWIEHDPAYAEVRERHLAAARAHAEQFTFRIPTRRANRMPGRRWDPFWPAAIQRALDDNGFDSVSINDGVYLRSQAERDTIVRDATKIADEHIGRLRRSASATPRR